VSASHHKIKFGDKLYLITRRDISPGYQAVQSAHAMRQFTHEHPEVDREWFDQSNHLALLSAPDEAVLLDLIEMAKLAKLKWSAFREPDIGDAITAIAIEPHPRTAQICKGLPLALRHATEEA
jgi:peptidyl-tRNA hydrolase